MSKLSMGIYAAAFLLCIQAEAQPPTSAAGPDSTDSAASTEERACGQTEHLDDSLYCVLALPQEGAPVDKWLEENGWEVQRGDTELFRIEEGTLLMKNIDASTVIGKKFDPAIDPDLQPVIRFNMRVEEIPAGADVTTKSMDDAAFRLFILFDKGGGFLSPPETIGYVWDSTMDIGEKGRSGRFDQIRYIVIGSGTEELREWKCIERNIVDDYIMLFGSDRTPDISAVALKCDSNHSGAVAASRIQWIRFRTEGTKHR